MKITNTTRGDLGLDEVHVVPARGAIDVPNEVLTKAKASPVVKAWFIEGKLIEDGAVEEPQAPVTNEPTEREAIIAGIIRGLDPEAFTKGGKPEVDAINDAMPKAAEPVTAAERDAVWDIVEAESD